MNCTAQIRSGVTLKVAENIRRKPIVGRGRSSQQGNEDRIQLGFYQEIHLLAFGNSRKRMIIIVKFVDFFLLKCFKKKPKPSL